MNVLSVGEYISDYLIKNDLSILAFSKIVNIDDLALRRWINGEFSPSAKNILILADFFKVSADFLLGLSEENTFSGQKQTASFASRLKEAMDKKNVTAYRLAKECRVGASCVTKWLKEKTMPTADNLVALSNYLGCAVDFLLGR